MKTLVYVDDGQSCCTCKDKTSENHRNLLLLSQIKQLKDRS